MHRFTKTAAKIYTIGSGRRSRFIPGSGGGKEKAMKNLNSSSIIIPGIDHGVIPMNALPKNLAEHMLQRWNAIFEKGKNKKQLIGWIVGGLLPIFLSLITVCFLHTIIHIYYVSHTSCIGCICYISEENMTCPLCAGRQ